MKRSSTVFLKGVILLIGIIALAGLIWFPHTEGRAANLDLLSIYLDPFIAYGYVASIPFFLGLVQAFRLLGYIQDNKTFTQVSVRALRNIKYSALALMAFIVVGEALVFFVGVDEDKAGVLALGLYLTFATGVFATGVAILQQLLQNAIDIKSENDLTV